MIESQLQNLDIGSLQLLIIENVGNLVCPASFDLGEDMRIVVLSIAEGEDKPAKYPVAFLNANTAVITKTDLSPYIDANAEVMKEYIAGINPKVLVFEAGKKDGVYSADGLVEYIIEQVKKKQCR